MPHFNVVNGGAHAANDLDFQKFMLAPLGAPSLAEAVRAGAEIYGRLKARLASEGQPTGLGDEGGFAPDIDRPEDVLRVLVSAIEDGLAEDDWDGWTRLTARLGSRVRLMGDDIFVTDPATIARAVTRKVGNSSLIKVNQIGTVTETLEAMRICREAGCTQMVSHRSGETPDAFIADLAVGTGCGQIKSGAPARGERVARYDRLLEIADAHPVDLRFGVVAP